MLGKLLKHEMKATCKVLLILQGFLVGFSLIECLLLNLKVFSALEDLGMLLLAFYILSIFAIGVATNLYLVVRFYRNMFTDEGYLTFTLPVKPYMHLWAKGINMAIWSLINMVATVISICILLTYKNILGEGIQYLQKINWSALNSFGIHIGQIIAIVVVFVIISTFTNICCYQAAICIGQLAGTHKVAASIGVFFGFQMLYQIVTSIASSISYMGIFYGTNQQDMDALSMEEMIHYAYDVYMQTIYIALGIYLVMGILYYVISHVIVCKKVNLQ